MESSSFIVGNERFGMSNILRQYMYKTIEIVTVSGKVFIGKCIETSYPEETATNEEGIVIEVKEGEMKGSLVEIVPSEVSEIKVIQ